jgi:glucose/arabinose dehydrogenase
VAQRTRPRGGDEINIPQKGKNYGWPLATHGNYSGLPIPKRRARRSPEPKRRFSSGSVLRR